MIKQFCDLKKQYNADCDRETMRAMLLQRAGHLGEFRERHRVGGSVLAQVDGFGQGGVL